MTNRELAAHLRELQAFLVIAGYDEMHARRYLHISHEIEQMGEPVEDLMREGRLKEIQGVGPSTAGYIKEILLSGKSSKQEEWEKTVPFTVVDFVRKTAQALLHEHGIFSLEALIVAIDTGRLANALGIGGKTLRTWRASAEQILNSR